MPAPGFVRVCGEADAMVGCVCSVGQDNLCYNGPRAGINWNDGFAGGSTVAGNLVFNMVRETGDHGPYNSWDRQPYLLRGRMLRSRMFHETQQFPNAFGSML